MSASRSAAGVTVFDGRVFVSGGHDGLQIFNTVSFVAASGHAITHYVLQNVFKAVVPLLSRRWSTTTTTLTAGILRHR